ncbi:undecaprenyldiphospho-muramoylpentapeptide beta-N-acetylglucosaminyltransferase [Granulibacter bethesdensis]|uniref:undecaprenyldiphospho-muramoylpentapeptide beta-N-acetylglucosaminyltransferase n=1 Tax=Granulibacter bethesdensis TaxID=364410 RepID=UPI0003F1F432|nr:undecaprenyldiphospho-muramoylpentapeptide beta-N-acetylglucosaminyltransferase [Granulibacter bethesdensis]AHJ64824.1 UDP-N-acetylglucosamine--N-acetylmuramyl-(pentapeptide) pyrophosphoryl-undecaprenol N-acetylglucosamine transferase [Granulibacter bethesdensis CGDNIH4]
MRRDQAQRPIIIAAGGTGGHFFPAEALAAELKRRGRQIVLMTDARSGGLTSTVFADTDRFVLPGAGIAGRGIRRAGQAVIALGHGVVKAGALLRRLEAGCIVGFGGYPCIPPVLGARLRARNVPVILHEQNAVLGRANRLLARKIHCLALSFASTSHVPAGTRTLVTGNPVRPAIAALAGTSYTPPGTEGVINLLILGGSLGARVLSDVVPAALALLPPALRQRMRVTQQCRAEDIDHVRMAYAACGIEAILAPFFTDVATLIADAHLVIARAGASTVAELATIGRPAIMVPLPGAIDDHQTANARILVDAQGGWMIRQPDFTPDTLAARIAGLLAEPGTLADAARNAARLGMQDAVARLADTVEQSLDTARAPQGDFKGEIKS